MVGRALEETAVVGGGEHTLYLRDRRTAEWPLLGIHRHAQVRARLFAVTSARTETGRRGTSIGVRALDAT